MDIHNNFLVGYQKGLIAEPPGTFLIEGGPF
jgi:hypothetical protein